VKGNLLRQLPLETQTTPDIFEIDESLVFQIIFFVHNSTYAGAGGIGKGTKTRDTNGATDMRISVGD
jgi:hypothetical protein